MSKLLDENDWLRLKRVDNCQEVGLLAKGLYGLLAPASLQAAFTSAQAAARDSIEPIGKVPGPTDKGVATIRDNPSVVFSTSATVFSLATAGCGERIGEI
jgi:hypothetical protein